jgi:hypothetical protein
MHVLTCTDFNHGIILTGDTSAQQSIHGVVHIPVVPAPHTLLPTYPHTHTAHPAQRKRQYTSTSTGFVAAGGERWLLTNAHSVDYHTQVRAGSWGR